VQSALSTLRLDTGGRRKGGLMQSSSLQDLFMIELGDLYDAENQLIKALPKMAKAASSESLRGAFEEHLEKTKEHAARIERIFSDLDMSAKREKCKGMQGLISEANDLLKRKLNPGVQDAGIIGSAQRVEHYEIAAYGTVRTWAELLQNRQAVDLLEQTLQEEKDADEKLTELAQQINVEAQTPEEGGEQETGLKRRAKAAS
jgi:ferritin-like metal-binding protein YciE